MHWTSDGFLPSAGLGVPGAAKAFSSAGASLACFDDSGKLILEAVKSASKAAHDYSAFQQTAHKTQ